VLGNEGSDIIRSIKVLNIFFPEKRNNRNRSDWPYLLIKYCKNLIDFFMQGIIKMMLEKEGHKIVFESEEKIGEAK